MIGRMRGQVRRGARAVARAASHLDDARSLPTAVVVARDVVTFGAIALSAVLVDRILEALRGSIGFFADVRLAADALLAFLAMVYVVEAVIFVLIDVAHAVRERWEDKLGAEVVVAPAREGSSNEP
jgi:hypothetical protein